MKRCLSQWEGVTKHCLYSPVRVLAHGSSESNVALTPLGAQSPQALYACPLTGDDLRKTLLSFNSSWPLQDVPPGTNIRRTPNSTFHQQKPRKPPPSEEVASLSGIRAAVPSPSVVVVGDRRPASLHGDPVDHPGSLPWQTLTISGRSKTVDQRRFPRA